MTISKKFICVNFTDQTDELLTRFCELQKVNHNSMDGFHCTIIYSDNEVDLANGTFKVPSSTFSIKPFGWEMFGPTLSCLVLRLHVDSGLYRTRQWAESKGLKDSWPEYCPHITLSYAWTGGIPNKFPQFPIVVDSITIADAVPKEY